MKHRLAWILITPLACLLFAWVATAGGVNLWTAPQLDLNSADAVRSPAEPSSGIERQAPPPLEDNGESSVSIPGWLEAFLQILLAIVAIAAGLAALTHIWKNRPRLRWRRKPRGTDDFEVLPDVVGAVVDEAAAQRAALVGGAPRNAIVRCWLRLEHDVATAGLPRHPADTSVEFTERVLSRYAVDSGAIHELAGLYREARFSEHELDESARQSALDALGRLHEALSAGATDSTEPAVGASS